MNYTFGAQCQVPNLNKIMLEHIGYKTDGVFVEIGAFDGYMWSNTYGLGAIGWKGLLFEPQKEMYHKCVAHHKDNDNIKVVRMALSDWQGSTDLFLGGSISTISEYTKKIYLDISWAKGTGLAKNLTENVQVSTLAHELAARSWPAEYDLLVVDVEGSELAVLAGSEQLACRPKLAIVETHAKNKDARLSSKAKPIDTFFDDLGYIKVQEDTINTIYVTSQ